MNPLSQTAHGVGHVVGNAPHHTVRKWPGTGRVIELPDAEEAHPNLDMAVHGVHYPTCGVEAVEWEELVAPACLDKVHTSCIVAHTHP